MARRLRNPAITMLGLIVVQAVASAVGRCVVYGVTSQRVAVSVGLAGAPILLLTAGIGIAFIRGHARALCGGTLSRR